MASSWQFRGTTYYLDAQARRLGVDQVVAVRARHNAEIYRVSVPIAQLCERYHRAPIVDGATTFGASDLEQIKDTLARCELEVEKLHALAAAAASIVDEAYAAFGLAAPTRAFGVASMFDGEDTA